VAGVRSFRPIARDALSYQSINDSYHLWNWRDDLFHTIPLPEEDLPRCITRSAMVSREGYGTLGDDYVVPGGPWDSCQSEIFFNDSKIWSRQGGIVAIPAPVKRVTSLAEEALLLLENGELWTRQGKVIGRGRVELWGEGMKVGCAGAKELERRIARC
jgi:hypothetical protein